MKIRPGLKVVSRKQVYVRGMHLLLYIYGMQPSEMGVPIHFSITSIRNVCSALVMSCVDNVGALSDLSTVGIFMIKLAHCKYIFLDLYDVQIHK